jgi:transcriptional regulator with XRE-family HTH domain
MGEAAWFGARLQELRECAGLTQPQLAERVGLGGRQLSRLETGVNDATWPTVIALAKALGVECTAFLLPPAERHIPRRGRPRKLRPAGQVPAPRRHRTRERKPDFSAANAPRAAPAAESPSAPGAGGSG